VVALVRMLALLGVVTVLVVLGYARVERCLDLGRAWERAILLPPLAVLGGIGGLGMYEALRAGRRVLLPRRVLLRQRVWAACLALLGGTIGFLQHLDQTWDALANCRETAPRVLEGVLLFDAVPTLLAGIVLGVVMSHRDRSSPRDGGGEA
jgi:hypothetical protein